MNPKLIIDNQVCDLPTDGVSVEFNYMASDGFTPAGSSSERSIELPKTQQNDLILSVWWSELGDNEAGTRLKDAYFLANGLPAIIGTAQIKSVDLKGDSFGFRGDKYRLALFGGNADFITLLGQKKLSDLDWSIEKHTYTEADTLSNWSAAAMYGTANYAYSVFKMKDWSVSLGGGAFAVTTIDTIPLLFIRIILDKITQAVGYTYNDLGWWGTMVGKKLAMSVFLPKAYPAEFAEEYLNGFFTRTTTKTYTGAIGALGGGLDFNTHTPPPSAPDPFADSVSNPYTAGADNAGSYKAKIAGYYKFEWTFKTGTIATFSGTVAQLASVVYASASYFPQTLLNIQPNTTYTTSFILHLNLDEFAYTNFIWGTSLAVGETFQILSSTVKVTSDSTEISYGCPIDFKYLLSNWTCADFLQGLTDALNLSYEANVGSKTLVLEPKNDYIYNDPPTYLTPAGANVAKQGFLQNAIWSNNQKLDNSKEASVDFVPIETQTVFRWKEDSNDPTVQILEQGGIFKLHECRYNRNENCFEVGEQVRENHFFAPLLSVIDTSIQYATVDTQNYQAPQVPLLWSKDYADDPTSDEKPSDILPRIVYFAGQRGYSKINYRDTMGNDIPVLYPECFQVNYNDLIGKDFSLSYCDNIIRGNTVKGLARRFFLDDMARSRAARNMNAFFNLNAADILQLSFRKRIILNQVQWLLKSVKGYDPINKSSSQVLLEYDQPQQQIDIDSFTDSPVSGYLGDLTP